MIHSDVATARRERKRAVVVAEILDRARGVVAAEGLAALTVGRLAGELGYVPAALYRYFESKDALIAALIAQAVEAAAARVRSTWATLDGAGDAPALAAILAGAEVYANMADEAPEQFALILTATGDPRLFVEDALEAGAVFERVAPLLLEVAARFDAAAEAGAMSAGPGAQRAIMFFAGLHGVLALRKLSRFEGVLGLELRALARAQSRALALGLGAKAEEVEAAERWLAARAREGRRS